MAFKKAPPVQNVPDSPEKLFLELPRRKIPGVLLHQGEMMQAYQQQAFYVPDVALQLPTGSGKTLVGLMIAEWRRRKNKERILYLCPTKQLVNQVVEQANEQYGLLVNGFTGSARNYDPTAKSQYQNADRVAVTTYSSLFNTNPFFNDPEVIIVDDAHAAENYIAALWSLKIERNNTEHQSLHTAISNLVKPYIDTINFTRLTGETRSLSDATWVDKLPTPTLHEIKDDLCAIIDTHAPSSDLKHVWTMIREHLSGCHLYLSSQEILIRPLIPPTWDHPAFNDAQQRIFMSATLGEGGDLERLTGRKKILRLPVPTGWDRQGIGRRYFVFPSLSLKDNEIPVLQRKMIEEAGKSIVLVPAERQKKKIEDNLQELSGFELFNAQDIEESKKPFINSDKAVAVIANRYDGIDFPGDDCRLLFIDGLPRTTNAQEKFLMSKMGANALFNERIQTRVLQAIGRCTRSLQDYSAVVVTGEHLPDYLVVRKRRDFFHPELQAEIEFGVEQSQETSIQDLIDNFKIFLSNDTEWEEENTQILDKRSRAEQKSFPAMAELMAVVEHELEFQRRMWQGDYDKAMQAAESVIAGLTASDLKGYRALWHYLAGSSAWKSGQNGNNAHLTKSSEHYKKSKEAAPSIPWLVSLSKYQNNNASEETNDNLVLLDQVERLEGVLTSLGTVHSRKYDKREKEILDGLNDPERFENAHKLLGELLGFDAGKEESDASPDPWWIVGDICFVFEDHAGAKATSKLDATKARQVATHPEWIKENLNISPETYKIIPVLVSPVEKVHKGAIPHLPNFYYWRLEDFKLWANAALSVIRELRTNFVEAGDLVWRSEACTKLSSAKLDGESIEKMLLENKASDKLNI